MVALALLYQERVIVGALEVAMLACLAALLGWMLLSWSWGIPGTDAGGEAARTFVYLTALAAFVIVVDSRARALLVGLAAGVGALAAYGAVDWLVSDDLDPFQGSLLAEPVGYANAMGILAAIGIVLSLGLASRSENSLRIPFLGLASFLALVLVLTQSRGAWLALGAGLLVLVLLGRGGARLVGTRKLWVVVAALLAAGVVVATAATTADLLGDRSLYWDAAITDARDHPLGGSGVGSFEEYWDVHGSSGIFVRDAHSLYLETLAELGVVGLALLLAALSIPLVAVARTSDEVAAAAAGGYVVFLVHAGLDWDWEMPAVTLTGLGCAIALLACAPERRRYVLFGGAYRAAVGLALCACAIAVGVVVRL